MHLIALAWYPSLMTPKQRFDDYPPSAATKRGDKALAAALSIGPIPHAELRREKRAQPKKLRRKKIGNT
jgi:hypothetical protein